MLAVVGFCFCAGKSNNGSVYPSILSIGFSLSGYIVVEVGEDDILVIDFIDDLSSLLDSLDDEIDLVLQIFDLADFNVDEIVLEHLLAALRILLHLLLQIHQFYGHLQIILQIEGLLLEVVQSGLDLFVLELLDDHLFGHHPALLQLMVYAFHQLLVLFAMHPVVFDQHEHISPTMLLISLQLLVFHLQSLDLRYVLLLYFDGIVLIFIADFF